LLLAHRGKLRPLLRTYEESNDEISIILLGETLASYSEAYRQIETGSIDSGEMALVEKGAEFRWILGDGSPAFAGSWQQAKDFQGVDPAAVLENRRWGFINRKGENIIPCRWDDTLGFDGNGRACVAIGRNWGAIDREGRLVVPLRFKSLTGFDDAGLSAAELPSGWGFIDRDGKIAIPFRYHKD